MVGARAIVVDPAPELREHQHHCVLVPVVLLQVVHEVRDGGGYIVPQLRVGVELVRVGVVAAVLGVVDTRSDVGEHDLRDILHVPRDRAVGVLDAG